MINSIFPFNQPFRDESGMVLIKKSETTIHGTTTIQVHENTTNYRPDQLRPMSQQEYETYLDSPE